MSPRASLLAILLVCGCNSDALVVVNDGAAPVDGSGGLGLDIAMPDVDDLAMPDLATGLPTWIRQFGTPRPDWADGVATDGMGNVYVAGSTSGALDGNQNAGGDDAFLVKYDAAGNKLWTHQFGTNADDVARDVATDGMGNIYVTGYTSGGLGGNQNAGAQDAFLVKYDADGTKLWTREMGTPGGDGAWGVATDGSGNVYVAGYTSGGLDGNQNAGGVDAFVVKYDANGNKLWTRQFGTAHEDQAHGIATDATGNVFVAGYTDDGLDGNQNAGSRDAFLVKYNANGNKLWTRQFGTADSDAAEGVATDAMGNIYVTGYTSGGLGGNQNAGAQDAFLVKYDADGKKLWTRQFGTPNSDEATGVSTDGAGNVYAAGWTTGGLDGYPNAGDLDVFLIKYDANGKKTWTRQFGTPAPEAAFGLAVDGAGGIYVAGSTFGAFAGNQNAGGEDAFLARFPAP